MLLGPSLRGSSHILRVDVAFVPPGHAESELMTVSFPGTNGNAGTKMPMGLQHGAYVNITGYRETDSTHAEELKAGMKDQALATGLASAKKDQRGVFVAQMLEYERDAGELGGRRLTGNAASQNTAVVVLYEPCGNSLQEDITKDRLESAFFSSGAGSFQQVIGVCSRGTVSFTGSVVGPISGCPDSNDAWATYQAIQSQLRGTDEWDQNYFKVMILPSSWLSAIGLGTVGGSLSWYRDTYVKHPAMFLHEIGHNWKLHHAGGAFVSQEYSDTSSAMGYCCSTRCYNFLHSWQLGFADFAEDELSLTDVATKSSSTALTLKALGTDTESGVRIHIDDSSSSGRRLSVPAFLVLSWRAKRGTDEYLQGTSYGDKVQVHHWDGDSRTDASITHLLHNVDKGSTILIKDTDRSGERILTDLKMTVKGVKSQTTDTVDILLCKRLSTESSSTAEADLTPCSEVIVETTATTSTKTTTTADSTTADSTTGGISFTATTSTPGTGTTTTLENPGGPWSAYFSDETGSKGVAPGTGLVGLGCSGEFCGSIRLSHRADVQLSSQSVTIHQLDADVGDLMCQSGQVATQVTCIGSSCSSIRLHCATPLAGRVSLDLLERLWFPSELHGTEDSYCHGDDVVVGVYCGGANCMTKKLVCATYIADDECVPSCDILGLECGDDGCGGSCGTCSSEDSSLTPMCRGDVGRCVYFVAADWVNEDKSMTATNLVSTGMGCSDDYCGNVRLIQMNVFVDAATAEKSDWISDNTGHRWFWNSGTAASDQAADCPDGMAVSYLKCDGRHCDNLRLHCGKPLQWQVEMTEDPVVTDWFSEEQGRMDCPDGKVVTGVECQDSKKWCFTNCRSYCDNKRLRCRSIKPEMAGAAILGVVPAAELPSAEPVPPSSSPWYEGAADTANNLWTGLSGVFQDSVSDAQPRGHRPLVTALAIRLLYYLS